MAELEIVVPVYNEGENIIPMLESLRAGVRCSYGVLLCYDHEADTTLAAVAGYPHGANVRLVKNRESGPHAAVRTGFDQTTAKAVLVMPADDDYNAKILDQMVAEITAGSDVVCASRFIPGGCMIDCPPLKAALVRLAAFTLYYVARLPTRDATNGLRMFSRRALEAIQIESRLGFTYSIEILAKAHRLHWKVTEVPARWFHRKRGKSRFSISAWIVPYLKWYFYAFATTYFFWAASPVRLRNSYKADK